MTHGKVPDVAREDDGSEDDEEDEKEAGGEEGRKGWEMTLEGIEEEEET